MKKVFEGLKFKAILLGFVIDSGLSLITGIILSIYEVVYFVMVKKIPVNELPEMFLKNDFNDVLTMVLGIICSIIGGYYAIFLAKNNQIKNSIAVGVLGTVIGIFLFNKNKLIFSIVSLLVVVPATYFGGWLFQKKQKQKNISN